MPRHSPLSILILIQSDLSKFKISFDSLLLLDVGRKFYNNSINGWTFMLKEEKNKSNSIKNQKNTQRSFCCFPTLHSNLFIKSHVFNSWGYLPNFIWLNSIYTFCENLTTLLTCLNDIFELASFGFESWINSLAKIFYWLYLKYLMK